MKAKNYSISLALVLISMVMSLQACVLDVNAIKGNKTLVNIDYSVDEFTRLDVSGMYKVILSEGDIPSVEIETDENLQDYVEVQVRNNTLYLSMESGNSYDPSKLVAYVTVNALTSVDLSGATSLESDFTLRGDMLSIDISGASEINLALAFNSLSTSVSGAGKIEMEGQANIHDLSISGAANVDCENLITENTDVSISGAGSARISASNHLDASVSGVGTIRYLGNPKTTDFSTSGIGSIKQL
jgi:hypothetical protein